MKKHLHHIRHDERGMSLIIVGMGMMAFMAAGMLAVDVGMLMTSRAQSQNAADAGAFAGAIALAFNDYTDRSSSGPAVTGAIAAAKANTVMHQEVSVTPVDVEFPNDPSGEPNRVTVTVRRTAARGNPLTTFMASMFGHASLDIGATATAESVKANAESCVKPWAIPDSWLEVNTPGGWDTSDTFIGPRSPTVAPDIFRSVTRTDYTGYTPGKVGLRITLTPVDVDHTIDPDMYYALQLPGASGEADFVSNILGCESSKMKIGDALTVEPAATTLDTVRSVTELIARDPAAYWNSASGRVVSAQVPSPRVVVIPVYDPLAFDQGKKVGDFTRIKISNFVGFFIDHMEGDDIVGRITPVAGLLDASGPAPVGSFARAIRLVQ
jgi:Flp pilus assembly protein TadG